MIAVKTDSDTKDFQKMEKDIATNILAMTSPQDVVLQRTEELCKEMSKMGKSNSTSVKALQHLSEEVAQLKILHENYMTEKETAIQLKSESVLQESGNIRNGY
ncbi:uncharacterized protein LOC124280066 [Haliotis rubra]|uniref:uncharacterized protein LOC124280066 n=1 Tax=Haliotis rubra TaxID=36100 RepID=UPI001EE5C592|nr:uncharacterized protein LOC124280066 [Haliotis rubra]